MTLLEAIIQGAIQGLTEFLPVSSSGHLSLFQHFFGIAGEDSLFFTLMLHVGTLVAVFAAFWKTIVKMIVEFFKMVGDIFGRRFSYRECNEERKMVIMVLVTLIPLAFFYVFAKGYMESVAEDSDIIIEGLCFLFTGTLLFLASHCVHGTKTGVNMTARDAGIIGLFQCIAMLPGVSRSGSTIGSGLMLGYSKEFMVKFSFIMGIPVILGASLVEFKDAMSAGIDIEILPVLIGVATAAVVGYFSIILIKWLVVSDRFGIFAYYTLTLGVLVVAVGIVESVSGMNFVDFIRSLSAVQ